MKNTIGNKDKLADKIEAAEKEKVEAALKEALEWLDENQSAEKEDYNEKLKEVEVVCNPVITDANSYLFSFLHDLFHSSLARIIIRLFNHVKGKTCIFNHFASNIYTNR